MRLLHVDRQAPQTGMAACWGGVGCEIDLGWLRLGPVSRDWFLWVTDLLLLWACGKPPSHLLGLFSNSSAEQGGEGLCQPILDLPSTWAMFQLSAKT